MWKTIKFLILSSIKSNATSIVVEVDSESNTYAVIDNGYGLDEDVIESLRNRTESEDNTLSSKSIISITTSSESCSNRESFFLSPNFKIALNSCDKFTIETSSGSRDALVVFEDQQLLEENDDPDARTRHDLGTSVFIESKEAVEKNQLISAITKNMEQLALSHHNSVSFALVDKSTKELVFRANRGFSLGHQTSLVNNISLNNVYCVSAGCDDFLVELCFVCDLKSDLKNILFRNGRYDQDTGVIDFALSEVSKYVPEVQVVANIVCSQQSSSFKEPIFQKCLEDCISAFLLHIRQQAINYKKMESLGDLTANPVKVAVPKNTIDLTGDDLEDEKWDPYFLDITNENEDDFYDYVCSEADTGFSDDTISKFRRRSRSFCDVEKWLEKMDLTKQPAGFNFEYEEEDIRNQLSDEAYLISIEEAKRAKLNPIPSQTSVKQVPVKLEHPVNKIIETANSRSAKPRLSDGVSLFSASHKKVYDKPSGKSGSAFTEKNFLRNVAHMSLEAEKTKKERESREAMRKLDFHAIINLAESNVKLNKKKPGEEPTKRRLADPPNFDAKSFKIPKKETTSKPHNIPIVKNKEAGRTTESAKQAHLSDIRKKAERKRTVESPDCSIISWDDNNNETRRKRKQDLDVEDLDIIDTYQVRPPPPKSIKSPESKFSPSKRYNIFTYKNSLNQNHNSEDEYRPSVLPTLPRRKTAGLKNYSYNKSSSSQFK